MIALILETIDKFSQYKSKRQFASYAGEEAANKWDDISSYLYLLLGNSLFILKKKCNPFPHKKNNEKNKTNQGSCFGKVAISNFGLDDHGSF